MLLRAPGGTCACATPWAPDVCDELISDATLWQSMELGNNLDCYMGA